MNDYVCGSIVKATTEEHARDNMRHLIESSPDTQLSNITWQCEKVSSTGGTIVLYATIALLMIVMFIVGGQVEKAA